MTLKHWNTDNKALFHSWSFGKINYQLFGIGLLIITIGYIIMATGATESYQSVKLAPLVLILGYCVFIPAAILIKPKNKV
jgi:dipeptide/tripeptide permease